MRSCWLMVVAFLLAGLPVSLPVGAVAAAPNAPVLISPAPGATAASFEALLAWANPPGTTQVHLQVTPYRNDGASVDLVLGAVEGYRLPPPPEWYGLLPDMTYTWRVQASDAAYSAPVGDPSWGPWSAPRTFRTPAVSGLLTSAVVPRLESTVTGDPVVLSWRHPSPYVFYYQLQVSTDPTFNTDPKTATAAVSDVLVHGGMSSPPNSYRLPFLTEPGVTYYWRVRPRIQGDGRPADWSITYSFTKLPNQGELIANGGFEQDGVWTDDCGCVSNTTVAGGWHSGMRGVRLQPVPGRDSGSIRQTVTIPADAREVALTYWYQLLGNGPTDSDCLRVAISEPGALSGSVKSSDFACASMGFVQGWRQASVSLDAYAGKTVTVIFQFATVSTTTHNNYVLLDDVSVTVH